MTKDLGNYLENMEKPWGVLFYRVVWEQLSQINNCKILDFGSGFGFTANHFAKNNDVTAIEPNAEMTKMVPHKNKFTQIIGDIHELKYEEDNSYDVIVCHNVFEYAEEREALFKEFYRVLKPNGLISIVKHNHHGRVMQKAVFENNLDEALSILNGGTVNVANFGEVTYYDIDNLISSVGNNLITTEKVLGIRTFWALQQNNEIKFDPTWQDKMFQLEMNVCNINDYINISFFNHILLRKLS